MEKYEWLENRTPRSINQLRLWPENPRFKNDITSHTLKEYVEDLIEDKSDKDNFLELVKSIAEDGFIPADPIVVWQNESNQKYYVAEGNRRVMALKLLRNPEKSPKSIRATIQRLSSLVQKEDIEKIKVAVAPSFEKAIWYINQRNSSSSLQAKWTRVQNQVWIAELYATYNGNIEKIQSITRMSLAQLSDYIRIIGLKNLVNRSDVKALLSQDEINYAQSDKFPITILERLLGFSKIKAAWGIKTDSDKYKLMATWSSFINAYSALLKLMKNGVPQEHLDNPDKKVKRIDTRITEANVDEILADLLPQVQTHTDENKSVIISVNGVSGEELANEQNPPIVINNVNDNQTPTNEKGKGEKKTPSSRPILKQDPIRSKLILPMYELKTSNTRLYDLFNELKKIPTSQYANITSAGIRIFLDLAIYEYIQSEGLEQEICKQYKNKMEDVTLTGRLKYLKINKFDKSNCNKASKIIGRLLDNTTAYPLDTLNGYMHSQNTHYLNKQHLNGFWDFLFPLFEILLDIQEVS